MSIILHQPFNGIFLEGQTRGQIQLSNPLISFENTKLTPKDLHTNAIDVKVYRF
jgi:hypothetical protein